MKIIIEGKIYDTEQAEELVMRRNSEAAANDPAYYYEALYQKKNTEFFLYHYENQKETILPLTCCKAKEWVKNHFSEKIYSLLFRYELKSETEVEINLRLKESEANRLKQSAEQAGLSTENFILCLLDKNKKQY